LVIQQSNIADTEGNIANNYHGKHDNSYAELNLILLFCLLPYSKSFKLILLWEKQKSIKWALIESQI